MDLGSPLTPDRMLDWIQFSYDDVEKEAILNLCEDNVAFQEWRSKRPNILDLLMCFPSLRIPAAAFVASLSKLMPRAYRSENLCLKTLIHTKTKTYKLSEFGMNSLDTG